ncbi:tetratricopeptide repeat protein [bacterium]|nr:tetratricopeptide repeat protein [candidate division CSSED10-310 bacterium]
MNAGPHMTRRSARTGLGLLIIIVNLGGSALLIPLVRHAGFVYDDELVVARERCLADIRIAQLFTRDYYERSGESTYRPLVTASYILDNALYGDTPAGYHATNLLLAALAGSIFGLFALRWGSWGGILAAVTFTVAAGPLEAIAGIAFREDLLAACGVLGSLLLFTRFVQARRGWPWLAAVVGTYGLALAAKESAIATPLLVAVTARFMAPPAERRLVSCLIALAVVTGLFLTVWFVILPAPAPYAPQAPPLVERLAAAPGALVFHLHTGFFPTRLSVEHPAPESSLAAWLVTLAFISVLAAGWRGRSPAAMGLALFLVALLPVLGIFPALLNPVAERYLYLPMTGLALAIGHGVSAATRRLPRAPAIALILGAAALWVVRPAIVRQRHLPVWFNDISLWTAATDNAPRSARAHFNLGRAMARQGRLDRAERELLRADELEPGVGVVNLQLGLLYDRRSNLRAAATHYRAAMENGVRTFQVYNNLGIVLAKSGQYEEAVQRFQQALVLQPGSLMAAANLEKAREMAAHHP